LQNITYTCTIDFVNKPRGGNKTFYMRNAESWEIAKERAKREGSSLSLQITDFVEAYARGGQSSTKKKEVPNAAHPKRK
jgi:hypothetical protein